MTVKELIEKLSTFDPKATVVTFDYEWGYFLVGQPKLEKKVEIRQGFFKKKKKIKNVVVI